MQGTDSEPSASRISDVALFKVSGFWCLRVLVFKGSGFREA